MRKRMGLGTQEGGKVWYPRVQRPGSFGGWRKEIGSRKRLP